jgi:archaemetzincin
MPGIFINHKSQIIDKRIILITLSSIDEHVLTVLKQNLEPTFKCKVESTIKIANLNFTYNRRRNQYSSSQLLSRLRNTSKGPDDKIVGIVDVDLFSPGWEFIFGEAEINSGIATLSFFRLQPENYGLRPDLKLFELRVVKEAIHELGHLFGLGHCENPNCAMYFCTSLTDVDSKQQTFCSKCQRELNKKHQR